MDLIANIKTSDVVRFYLLQLGREGPTALAPLLPLILGTGAGMSRGVKDSDAGAGLLMGIGVAVGTVVLGFIFITVYVAMILSRLNDNQPIGEVHFELANSDLIIKSHDRQERFSWSDLTDSGSDERFIWMHFSDRHYRFVPRRSLAADNLFASARNVLHEITGESESANRHQ